MNTFWWVVIVLVILPLLPMMCYLCVKMAVMGYLVAKHKFEEKYNPQGFRRDEDGEESRRA